MPQAITVREKACSNRTVTAGISAVHFLKVTPDVSVIVTMSRGVFLTKRDAQRKSAFVSTKSCLSKSTGIQRRSDEQKTSRVVPFPPIFTKSLFKTAFVEKTAPQQPCDRKSNAVRTCRIVVRAGDMFLLGKENTASVAQNRNLRVNN